MLSAEDRDSARSALCKTAQAFLNSKEMHESDTGSASCEDDFFPLRSSENYAQLAQTLIKNYALKGSKMRIFIPFKENIRITHCKV